MKKEEWINSILESAEQIKQAGPNAYLFQKIESRINQAHNGSALMLKFRLRWALVIVLALAVNASALLIYKSKTTKQKEAAALETLTSEINSTTTYNY